MKWYHWLTIGHIWVATIPESWWGLHIGMAFVCFIIAAIEYRWPTEKGQS